VRYIAAPTRNGPGGPRGTPIPGLRARLADQLDLTQLRVDPGLVLYENTAWFPARGVATPDAEVPTGDVAPIPAALGADLAGDVAPLGPEPAGPGLVVYSEAFDEHWEADAGRALRHQAGFGWANAYPLPEAARVDLRYTNQGPTTLMVASQALVWALVAVLAWRGRRRLVPIEMVGEADPGPAPHLAPESERRERAQRRRAARAAARDRRRRAEFEDDFWGDA
jgi:hypothetical protein